jgi:hypothetical protein
LRCARGQRVVANEAAQAITDEAKNIQGLFERSTPFRWLFVHLTGIDDHAMGSGIGIDNFSSGGDTKMATTALSLNLNPPPPTAGIVPLVPLQVIATGVQASANSSVVALMSRPPC